MIMNLKSTPFLVLFVVLGAVGVSVAYAQLGDVLIQGNLTVTGDGQIDGDFTCDGCIDLQDLEDLSFPNIYRKFESYELGVGDDEFQTLTESCDAGDILLNGGFQTSGGISDLTVYGSHQAPNAAGDNIAASNTWVVSAKDVGDPGGGVFVYVTCLNTNP